MTQRPVPVPDEVSAPFWTAADNGSLVVQRCSTCQALQYPPDMIANGATAMTSHSSEVSGRGQVYSFATVDRAFLKLLRTGFPTSSP